MGGPGKLADLGNVTEVSYLNGKADNNSSRSASRACWARTPAS